MTDFTESMLFSGLFLLVGLVVGWSWAHQEVATECERQGGFYVGERDFVCAPKSKEGA